MFAQTLTKIKKHKIEAGVGAIIILGGGYWAYTKVHVAPVETRYVVSRAEIGTLITSVSGSGQVVTENQVEVKSKASGDVVTVAVKNGQTVKAGQLLIQQNARDAYNAVRDASVNLENAKLSLTKLQQPANAYSILQAENSLASARTSLEKLKLAQPIEYQKAQDTKQKAADDLVKGYQDAYNTITDTFQDLPTVLNQLYTIVASSDIGKSESTIGATTANDAALVNSISSNDYTDRVQQLSLVTTAKSSYHTSKTNYDSTVSAYQNSTRAIDPMDLEKLLQQTVDTTKLVADTLQTETNMLDFWVSYRTNYGLVIFTTVKTYQSNLATYTSDTNSHLSSLLAIQRTLKDAKQSEYNATKDLTSMDKNNPLDVAAAENSVKEKEASLENLRAGAEPLDVRAQELTVKQRVNALSDVQGKLADYSVRAPFDGVIAKVSVKKGDILGSGAAVATLITKQQTAQISLNEVDVAKIKVGQKTTLTFDAIEELSISGEVAEIDALGTVSQGVVTYVVKIIFDTQDERIKPGMSLSAAIITNVKTDVVMVPNSALKTSGANYYVEIFEPALADAAQSNQGVTAATLPAQKLVEVGLTNDTMTEIVSGLKAGDQVVTRTITATTKTAAAAAPSLFGAAGGNRAAGGGGGGAGGGAVRFGR